MLLSHIMLNNEDFTTDELKKLRDSLNVTEEDLTLLLQSIKFIAKQSARVLLRPSTLQQQLIEKLKFVEDKAEIFTKLWSEITKIDIGSTDEIKKLDDITWEQNILVSDQILNEPDTPYARIQLSLSSTRDCKRDKVTIAIEKEELFQLYNTLEAIQMKLDIMNS